MPTQRRSASNEPRDCSSSTSDSDAGMLDLLRWTRTDTSDWARFDKSNHVRSVLETVIQGDVSVASPPRASMSAHDATAGTSVDVAPRPNANTTSFYRYGPVQMKGAGEVVESVLYLHQRLRVPTIADETLSAHNPKVVGSNPTPATKNAQLRGPSWLNRKGLVRCRCTTDVPSRADGWLEHCPDRRLGRPLVGMDARIDDRRLNERPHGSLLDVNGLAARLGVTERFVRRLVEERRNSLPEDRSAGALRSGGGRALDRRRPRRARPTGGVSGSLTPPSATP